MKPSPRMAPAIWLAATFAAAACGSEAINQPETPQAQVASIEVTPGADTLTAIGETRTFTATARDASGATVSGVTFTWSSSDESVATVSGGQVTAVADGEATVTAAVGSVSGGAAVAVVQMVETVTVSPPNLTLDVIGTSQQLTAEARDAMNNVMTGQQFLWVSGDPGIATVDTTGKVTGVARGVVTVSAAARGVPGNAVVTVAPRTYVTVSSGEDHACGLTDDGEIYCWGANTSGQLGVGSSLDLNLPGLVTGGMTFFAVSAGGTHSCGIATDSAAYCWGNNAMGQLGSGTAVANSPNPIAVAGGHNFAAIAAGAGHSCGVTDIGDVYCWGANGSGQLGDGSQISTNAPVQTSTAETFESITAGGAHTCAVSTNGTDLYCWGDHSAGQIGIGVTIQPWQLVPAHVSSQQFGSASAGELHTCAVQTTGYGWCWGTDSDGQLGNGGGGGSDMPVSVSGGLGYVQMSAGNNHSCGVTQSGTAYCWGNNTFGMLGDGTLDNSQTIREVSGGLGFAQVSAGGRHSCGVTVDGDALCWGDNTRGQLGSGDNFSSNVPVLVR